MKKRLAPENTRRLLRLAVIAIFIHLALLVGSKGELFFYQGF